MSTLVTILLLVIAAYAWWQRQRRAWTERVMIGYGQAAKFTNMPFKVQWVGEQKQNEPLDQVVIGLVDPANTEGAKPVLIIDAGHPNFGVCVELKKEDEVLMTFNPAGWKWGDETACAQNNWARHVVVTKKN